MEHTLEIQKIIHGGSGLGYLSDGMVVMVPQVLPRELVRVKERKRTKKFLQASLVRVEQPSPHRVQPPCPYYGRCGGCNLQHIAYEEQLTVKGQLLGETLERSRLDLSTTRMDATLASPLALGYRHRIRLHLNTRGELGFHRWASNTIIPIEQCLLATPAINRALKRCRQLGLDPRFNRQWKAIELLESPAGGELSIVLHPRKPAAPSRPPAEIATLADHAVIKDPASLRRDTTLPAKAPLQQEFSAAAGPYTLSWDSHCFFQVNVAQNQQLVTLVSELLGQGHGRPLLDLYCGIGNFSLPAALLGWQVTGIEHNRRSILWARANQAATPLAATTAFQPEPVRDALLRSCQDKEQVATILLDPPRQGLEREALQLLPQLGAERIIYISCDPATLGRDLALLCGEGYRLVRAVPVDMFPQSHHIESVVVLEKN
ncbi:class I SAM-dependent RNA methyltransferase [Desulfogranum mediterraneum]|uniref:class I SAM-dependent RNA methyltransferase n=1 Tax=Desulfogranum mediterraneum TaxID=160661 RepID=UPI0004122C29|nr:class I SAM-dependent RNA methyltransferase [Desulfogranum mediterraneum]